MGVVYEAEDPELSRPIALKLIRPELANQDMQSRLAREARALARLSHPNVVAVHDVGTFQGQVFVAMELVAGETLTGWAERKPRRVREILSVLRQAGDGLHAAHQAGLVHRDFKPDNILIDEAGRTWVTDFGLAKEVDTQAENTHSLKSADAAGKDATDSRAAIGTPRYMAPEQHRGHASDRRADVFSFCVTLYEMLFGSLPFPGATVAELRHAVLAGNRVDPPRRPRVPKRLRRALMVGLSADPDERHASMEPLLRALTSRRQSLTVAVALLVLVGMLAVGAFLAVPRARPDVACADSDRRLLGIWDDGRRALVKTALAKTAAGPVSPWPAIARSLDAYAQAWGTMHGDACQATQRGEQSEAMLDVRMHCLETRLIALDSIVDQFASGHVRPENAFDATRDLPRLERCSAAETLEARIPVPVDEPTRVAVDVIRNEIIRGDAARLTGQYADAIAILAPLEARAEATGYRPILAEVLYHLGVARSLGEMPSSGAATLHRAALAGEAGRHDEIAAEAWLFLIGVQGADIGDLKTAHEYAAHAEASIERLGHDPQLLAQLHHAQGHLHYLESQFDDALARFAEAEQGFAATHDEENRQAAREGTAMVLSDLGRFAEALAVHEELLAVRMAALGPDHPDVALSHTNVGDALMRMDRATDALDHAREAQRITESTVSPGHPDRAWSLHNVGEILRDLERYDEGLDYFTRSHSILLAAHGPRHQDVATSLEHQGGALLGLEQPERAADLMRRALEIFEQTLGNAHFETVRCRTNLAVALVEAGQTRAALDQANRSLHDLEDLLGEGSPFAAYPRTYLGVALLELHRPREAALHLERAMDSLLASGLSAREAAVAKFNLARALYALPRDRSRALDLAKQARAEMVKHGPGRWLRRLDPWLAGRSPPRGDSTDDAIRAQGAKRGDRGE
jgi:tetratricopeptide (TPR) repeat protein